MGQKRAGEKAANNVADLGVEKLLNLQKDFWNQMAGAGQRGLQGWPIPGLQLPELLDQNPFFDQADTDKTGIYGQGLANRMQEASMNPASAAALWGEIYLAWLRLWMPSLQALQQGRPAEDPRPIDIFLSHSRQDESRIRDLRERLDALGTVRSFVDWIDAPAQDRSDVSAKTADWLRREMRASKTLVLLLSEQSAQSFWVQWELGYFDALRGFVYILPLDEKAHEAVKRQEYYDLYQPISSTDELIDMLKARLKK